MKTWLGKDKTRLENENVALKVEKTLMLSEIVTRKGENAFTERNLAPIGEIASTVRKCRSQWRFQNENVAR